MKTKHFDEEFKAMKKGNIAQDALKNSHWPNNRIPYVFSSSSNSALQSAVRQAISEFSQRTCLKFVQRKSERDYIEFFPGQGCWSYIGRARGRQQISLGKGCESKGVAIHEMMHAIGFWHEQSRTDRDNYVRVLEENIMSGAERNFQKYKVGSSDTYGQAYDKRSVMHYGSYAFSKNGRKTIVSRSDPNERLGQRDGMSEIDAKQIRLHYKCDDVTTTTTVAPTTVAPTTAPVKCGNKMPFCNEISTRWCKANDFSGWMRANCKQRCQLCKQCKDKHRYCRIWKERYCFDQRYRTYMRNNCAASCNYC